MTDEEYVRSEWKRVEVCKRPSGPDFAISMGDTQNTFGETRWHPRKSNAFSAAASFTRDLKEEIRQLERQITLQESFAYGAMDSEESGLIAQTIAILQSILTEKKRGLKS